MEVPISYKSKFDYYTKEQLQEKDYDYDHLMNVYQQILEWHEKTKRGKKS